MLTDEELGAIVHEAILRSIGPDAERIANGLPPLRRTRRKRKKKVKP
jgi:hypothetical protein